MFMDKPKVATITFAKEDLLKSYNDPLGCPIYHALNDAGVEVFCVDNDGWWSRSRESPHHTFSAKLMAVSIFLQFTNRIRWIRPLLLKNISVKVEL